MADFEPRIVAFCCNWCSYAGADGAGVARLQMPTNFRIIRTMCSARVDPEFVLRAFSKGADGFDPKRLKLEWVSASEGEKFQKTIVEFVDVIKELGPTPLVKGDE